jgi:hypothetical protein
MAVDEKIKELTEVVDVMWDISMDAARGVAPNMAHRFSNLKENLIRINSDLPQRK